MAEKAKSQGIGSRMGHKVTIRKLEKELADGTKVPTHSRYSWRATFVEGGTQKQKYFKTRKAAEEWAGDRQQEALNHGTDVAITSSERAAVVETRSSLKAVGLDLRRAIDFAIDYRERVQRSCTVSEMVKDAIRSRKRSGLSDRHIRDMRGKLGRFEKDFGERSVATITRPEVEDWLHGLGLAPASVNSYRRILVVAFNDVVKDGQIDVNPAAKVRQSKVVESEVGILTPKEAADLLANADPSIIPAIALGLFTGLRISELEQLDWSEVQLDHDLVKVAASKAKSARNRLVSVPENLKKWLAPYAMESGSVWPESHQQGRKRMEDAHNAAGFGTPTEVEKAKKNGSVLRKWPDNALRHSYATYHLAHNRDAAALALNLGHTNTDLIFAHYRLPVTAEEAATFWSITPENAADIAANAEPGSDPD